MPRKDAIDQFAESVPEETLRELSRAYIRVRTRKWWQNLSPEEQRKRLEKMWEGSRKHMASLSEEEMKRRMAYARSFWTKNSRALRERSLLRGKIIRSLLARSGYPYRD